MAPSGPKARLPLSAAQKKNIEDTLDSSSTYYGERALIEAYGNLRESDGEELGGQVDVEGGW